ncbi:MAG: sterol desaturase family protein [Gammaproteobacteria bacterium]|nr:sterol desaturase family protein [Gammaproteobacteria bacterium]|tara:strand:+ start:1076 stop:2314 length:1239 start_codon:yes stop_codon:yes gene_type:complete
MDSSIFITYAVPVFFLMIGIEFIFGVIKGTNNYRLNDSIAAISLGLISRLPPLLNLGIQGVVWTYVATNLNMSLMPKDSWVTWVIAFLFYDLCYYWMHRMSHEVKVLWASHVVHHQGEEFNLSTALRQTSSGWLWKWIFYIPMFMVGIPGEVFFTVAAINLLYQFWVHTEHIKTLGALELIFITPSNHRIHHAQNPEYIDANYGGVFIIWDRIFGTYIPERDDLKPIYGTVKPLRSWNPIWSNLEIYHQMIRDTIHTKTLKNKIKVWFSSTRWRPEDVYEKFPHVTNDLEDFEKYDPDANRTTKFFTSVQFIINSSISTIIIFTIADQSYLQSCMLAIMLVASTTLVTSIIENKKWGYQSELARSIFTILLFAFEIFDPNLLASQVFFYQSIFSIAFIAVYLPINKQYLFAR